MPRVAIACQGGGSHTAFTAGVLKVLIAEDAHEIVAMSGTSGGGICALLAWYGLLTEGIQGAIHLLDTFWEDIKTSTPLPWLLNRFELASRRVFGEDATLSLLPYFDVRPWYRAQLSATLSRHIDFARIRDLPMSGQIRLMIGAVDLVSGEHRVFDSQRNEVTLEAILASAAIPKLFPSVKIDGHFYWDGLFSQNPPLRDLHEAQPDEIWIVQINPKKRTKDPRTTSEILDRRNELAGNSSLEQEIYFVQTMNRLRLEGHLSADRYRCIRLRRVALERELDLASKVDRSPTFIEDLQSQGGRAAEEFLEKHAAGTLTPEDFPSKYPDLARRPCPD